MRKVLLIAGLMTAFLLAVIAASAAANFGGTWALDKTKSQGLSQGMMNAESVTWTITQDDKTISIDSKVTGGQQPAGGGGGGGTGGGRGAGMGGPRTYNLDGKEVTSDAGGQMGGTNTMKATWSSDGKTLELSTVRAGNFNGNEVKFTNTDKLSLNGDGKVLTVNRHSESPRGNTESTLTFNKQ